MTTTDTSSAVLPIDGATLAIKSVAFGSRYVVVETVICGIINVAIAILITFLKTDATVVMSGHEVLIQALPSLVMSALMGALIPSAVTLFRHRRSALQCSGAAPSSRRLVLTALCLTAICMLPGIMLSSIVLWGIAGTGLGQHAIIFFNAACAGGVTIVITPAALVLLFGQRQGGIPSAPF